MKSENFEILRDRWPELASLGGFAEAYAHADSAGALMKLRLFAENLTRDIYQDLRLPKPDQPTFIDLLKNSAFEAVTPKVVLDKLHALRIHGNKAAHGETVKMRNALWLLREAHDLARWLLVRYGGGDASSIPPFRQQKNGGGIREGCAGARTPSTSGKARRSGSANGGPAARTRRKPQRGECGRSESRRA